MAIGVSVSLTLVFFAFAFEALANCLGLYNAARFIPGWDINYGPNFGEFSRGISGPHIFAAGPDFGPMGHVSGVGVPNNFWGGAGYPGNLDDRGAMGELSYIPSDAANPMLNFWGGGFPTGVNAVNGALGNLEGLGGFGVEASQRGFPGFHGFGGFPGLFGPPIGAAEVAGQGFPALNGQPAAIASPPAGDANLSEGAGLYPSGSRLLNALEKPENHGSNKKSDKRSKRNRNRNQNRNVNMNFNQAIRK